MYTYSHWEPWLLFAIGTIVLTLVVEFLWT